MAKRKSKATRARRRVVPRGTTHAPSAAAVDADRRHRAELAAQAEREALAATLESLAAMAPALRDGTADASVVDLARRVAHAKLASSGTAVDTAEAVALAVIEARELAGYMQQTRTTRTTERRETTPGKWSRRRTRTVDVEPMSPEQARALAADTLRDNCMALHSRFRGVAPDAYAQAIGHARTAHGALARACELVAAARLHVDSDALRRAVYKARDRAQN
jgi:GH24 family phage-related lysozyme (muramidase)